MVEQRPRQIARPGGGEGSPGTTGDGTPLDSDYDVSCESAAGCTLPSFPLLLQQVGGFDAEGLFQGAISRLRPPFPPAVDPV